MKYRSEIVIDLPRARVIELFDDPANLKEWQPGLQSFEHVSGEPGEPGAKSRLVFDEKGRRMEMIETITARNLPDEFSAVYETSGVVNIAQHHFFEEGAQRTRWVADNEFQFGGFMKVVAFFMRGAFPKQTMVYLEGFKRFAEGRAAAQSGS